MLAMDLQNLSAYYLSWKPLTCMVMISWDGRTDMTLANSICLDWWSCYWRWFWT